MVTQSIIHVALVVRPSKTASYGTVAVFEDLYGNLWGLDGPNQEDRSPD